MYHDLSALVGFQAERVVGIEDFHHGAIRRRHHDLVGRANRQAVTDRLAGESFVRHLIERHDFTRHRRHQRFKRDFRCVRHRLRFDFRGRGRRRSRRSRYRAGRNYVAHCAGNQLGTGADDHLYALLVQTNNARRTKAFRQCVVHQRRVLHVQTQAGDAGVDAGQVVGAADRADVATGQRGGFVLVFTGAAVDVDVITVGFVTGNRQLAARGHQVELVDGEAEHHIVDNEEHQALRDQHVPVGRQRVTHPQHHIHQAGAETEA